MENEEEKKEEGMEALMSDSASGGGMSFEEERSELEDAVDVHPTVEEKYCMNKFYEILANGGNLIDWCKSTGERYSDVMNWIQEDPDRLKRYEKALECRGEYLFHRIMKEFEAIGFSDTRDLYDEQGNLKPPSEWPDSVAGAISGVDTTVAKYDKDGELIEPETKKIRLYDKLRALELMGKNLKMFVDRHEHEHKMTLEDLVNSSVKEEGGEETSESKTEEASVEKAVETETEI